MGGLQRCLERSWNTDALAVAQTRGAAFSGGEAQACRDIMSMLPRRSLEQKSGDCGGFPRQPLTSLQAPGTQIQAFTP